MPYRHDTGIRVATMNMVRNSRAALTKQQHRRTLLVAGLLAALNLATKISTAADDLSTKVSAGLMRLSNQIEYDNVRIALFTDGSPAFTAAAAAVKSVGGTVVEINANQDLATLRAKYRESNCFAAIVPDAALLKTTMLGEGLLCERFKLLRTRSL